MKRLAECVVDLITFLEMGSGDDDMLDSRDCLKAMEWTAHILSGANEDERQALRAAAERAADEEGDEPDRQARKEFLREFMNYMGLEDERPDS